MKTRFRDKNGEYIYLGDIVHVEEYPDKYVGGSLDFEGVISKEKDGIYITYLDIGEQESYPLKMFPVVGREILSEKERYNYWRSLLLGAEPPESLYKREIYGKEDR